MKKYLVSLLIVLALLVGGCGSTESPTVTPTAKPTVTSTPKATLPPTKTPKFYSEPPPMLIDQNKQYTAIIVTEKGNITLELFDDDVPITVNNFVFLAREGFYDGCTFYRVIPDFMAQGGDPTGTGAGWPGYFFADEFSEHTHVTGALSMANAGAGTNTNGCQFFITYTPQHHLDGLHSVFGQLMDGMDVLLSLTPRNPTYNPQYKGDTIITITIVES
jgi:cyclophilin family peptidyl-prolyl cis-trans isomerase